MEAAREYILDKRKLIESKNKLLKLPFNESNHIEIVLIDSFLNSENLNDSIYVDKSKDFQSNFERDKKAIMDDYYEYMNAIINFSECSDVSSFCPYQNTKENLDSVFESVHDFYRDLDSKWYKTFYELYKRRYESFCFKSNSAFSFFLPTSNLWLASIPLSHTIQDNVLITHEFAHGIVDYNTKKSKAITKDNVLVELFPIVCQLLYIESDYCKNNLEKAKYIVNFNNEMVKYANDLYFKMSTYYDFNHVKTARNLSRIIKRKTNTFIPKSEINEIWKTSAVECISYVYPFIIANELLEIYKKDKELFINYMNEIITSQDTSIETLKRLKLTPKK